MSIFGRLKGDRNHIEVLPGLAADKAELNEYIKGMNIAAKKAAALEGIYLFEVEIVLANDGFVQDLNRRFRGIDASTDVLSFPANDIKEPISKALAGGFIPERSEDGKNIFLGEIYISLDKAKENAKAYGNTDCEELCFLTVHGMLHLMGYDHMKESDELLMRARQREALGRKAEQ